MHSTTSSSPAKSLTTDPSGSDAGFIPQIPDHELLRCIGSGGYGQIWLARNALGAYRAVKIVYRRSFEEERPYEREFQGIEKFEPISRSHQGLVDILQVGRNDPAGYFYYVMELADDSIQGSNPKCLSAGPEGLVAYHPKTLRSEIHERGRLPLEECLQVALSLAEALSHLHGHGLVHRDIKPSNIIFVDGIPKLADIGLVAPAGETLSLVGTDGFIPPEGPGTPQADLYSLGKVLYEISSGKDRRAYPEPLTHLAEPAEAEGLRELNAVILKACAPDARLRYQSARQLLEDVRLLKSGGSVQRLRRIERRLAVGTRIGVVLLLAAILAGAAYFQASRAEKKATHRLIRSHVANAERLMDEVDFPGALPWVAECLRLAEGDPLEERLQRFRFAALWSRCPRLIALCLHEKRILHAAFSADGRQFATASADHTARLWDAATGQALIPPLEHGQEVRLVAISPDGRRVATISQDAVLRIWDAATGRLAAPPIQHRLEVRSLAFSSDGRKIVTGSAARQVYSADVAQRLQSNGDNVLVSLAQSGNHGEAQVWDAETGRALTAPMGHRGQVYEANFSPDGARVVIAGEEQLATIWDATTGQALLPPLRHAGKVRKAVFSPDNRRVLTASEDQTAQLWDATNGTPVGPPMRHAKAVLHAAFSPDGRKIVTTSRDQTAGLWDAKTGQLLCLPLRHNTEVRYAEFSPDSRWLATAGSEQLVRVWDAASGELLAQLPHNNSGTMATFSRQHHRLLTISRDGLAKVWDLDPLLEPGITLPHEAAVLSAEFSSNGTRVLTVSVDRTARIWNVADGEPVSEILRDVDKSGDIRLRGSFSPDGSRAVHSRVFETVRGQEAWGFRHGSAVCASQFSRDGRWLVTGGRNGTVRFWDAMTGQPTGRSLTFPATISAFAFSPNHRWMAIAYGDQHHDGKAGVQVWDVATRQPAGQTIPLRGFVSHISFSPDGDRLLTACTNPPKEERAAELWDWRTGRLAIPGLRHHDGVPYAEFSPDGKRILTASYDKTARVWDAKTGRPLGPPLQHHRQVEQAVFSPDGHLIVSACNDGSVRLWQAATGEALGPPFQHLGPVWRARFSPTGRQIVSASDDHTARLWPIAYTERSILGLLAAAALWSGQETDPSGSVAVIDSKELFNRWRHFRARYPDDFEVGDSPGPEHRTTLGN